MVRLRPSVVFTPMTGLTASSIKTMNRYYSRASYKQYADMPALVSTDKFVWHPRSEKSYAISCSQFECAWLKHIGVQIFLTALR